MPTSKNHSPKAHSIELCVLADIDNHHSKGFVINEESIFVVRKHNSVYAYRNRCPHMGIELNWVPDGFLTYEKELIQCSTHGALFNIHNGLCVAGPCSKQSLVAVECFVRDGTVFVTLEN